MQNEKEKKGKHNPWIDILKWIKENPFDSVIITSLFVISLIVIFQHYVLGWLEWRLWTGFGKTISADKITIPGKTLWDWMELLLIPFGIVYIANRFSNAIKRNEYNFKLDEQREIALQTYFDRITDFLLHENGGLKKSVPGDEIRIVVRSRTLSTIRMLDPHRKGNLLLFLYDAGLISGQDPIIPLYKTNMVGVDLSGANLSGASLERVDFQGVDLNCADLSNVDFEGAILSGANLQKANLSNACLVTTILERANMTKANLEEAKLNSAFLMHANLSGANLRKSNLSRAFLRGADLKGADLTEADLHVANFWAADLSDAKLDGAILPKELSQLEVIFEDATMPDGNRYDPKRHKFRKVIK